MTENYKNGKRGLLVLNQTQLRLSSCVITYTLGSYEGME